MTERDLDLIIVGGGMVGATIASLLRDQALSIAVIDSQQSKASTLRDDQFEPRVSALSIASEKILCVTGAWPLMEKFRLSPYSRMDVWDAGGTGSIQFDAEDIGASHLGHIIENSVTQQALENVCSAADNIRWIAPLALESIEWFGDRWILKDDKGDSWSCKLLIGADGANSFVRQQAGICLKTDDYQHSAIVTTVKTALPHGRCARQCFLNTGPVAFLPLVTEQGDEHYSSIVWSVEPCLAESLMNLNDNDFCQRLAQAFELRLGLVEKTDRRYSFPLTRRHAETYIQPGLALAGDAAHTIHPLAGQGANLGLLDAAALVGEIIQANNKGLCIGSEHILRRYQRRRRGHNLLLMELMSGFKRLFEQEAPAVCLARNSGMNFLNKTPLLKNHIIEEAMGLKVSLPDFIS